MSNDKFEWTDSKVLEFALKVKTTGDAEWVMPQLEQFKQEQLSKRDWEILEFRNTGGDRFIFVDGKYGQNGLKDHNWEWRNLEHTLKHATACYPYSVRRLSDGEVFSVGDYFQVDAYAGNKPFRIKEFRVIDNDWIQVQADSHNVHNWHLRHIKKAELFLFTTDDGIDVFQGVEVWIVRQNFDYNKFTANKWDNCQGQNLHIIRTRSNGCKYFSTKESAEDWIAENKPLLSVKDIAVYWCINGIEKAELKQLAKSKMDGKK